MITTSAERIFNGVNELLSGQSEMVSTAEFPAVRGHIDLALGEAWNSEWWQFLMRGEWRYFRALWLAASTYDKTDEVYDAATQQYFQCLRDSVTGAGNSPTDSNGDERSAYWALCKESYAGNNWASGVSYAVGTIVFYPVTAEFYQCHTAHTSSGTLVPDATGGNERWGVLTPFERFVDFSQANGQESRTEIGDVHMVTDANPRATEQWNSMTHETLQDREYIADDVTRAFITFSIRRPRLTGTFYVSTSAYAVGDQVYFTPSNGPGNFYKCIATASAGDTPQTDTDKWTVVELPLDFEGFLIWSAYGKLKTADEDAEERARALAMAEGYLMLAMNRKVRKGGQTPALPVRSYR